MDAVTPSSSRRYLPTMATRGTDGFVEPCIPTLAAKAPSGPGWVHEIKHDGYRLIVRRDGKAVRPFTRATRRFEIRIIQCDRVEPVGTRRTSAPGWAAPRG
jgi:hypothetical protein